MAGIILRMATFGLLDTGSAFMCCGGLCLGICALCGLYKCSQLRIRDCSCIKWCLRKTVDDFDDFSLMVIVHEASYVSTTRRTTSIRLTAGREQVQTNVSAKGIFQEALEITIEQGTSTLAVELMEGKTIIASFKIPVLQSILSAGPVREKEHTMQSKVKGLNSPIVKLTMSTHKESDVEKGILTDMNLSKETQILLHQALVKESSMKPSATSSSAGSPDKKVIEMPKSPIEAIAQGLRGNIEMLGSMGGVTTVYGAVSGPPAQKKIHIRHFQRRKGVQQRRQASD